MNNIKKHNNVITLIFFLSLTLSIFTACINNSHPVILPTPINLQINGTTLTWDEVENADGYIVNINGTEYTAKLNTYNLSPLTEPDNYNIQIMALGDGKNYLDSNYSQNKKYVIEPEDEGNFEFTYRSKSNTYAVTGIGTVTSTDIVIPSIYNGLPVTAIWSYAFEDNVNITSVTLPDTVTQIFNSAFYGCKALETIEMSDSVNFIGYQAFSYSGLKSFKMPDSLTSINNIFNNCLNLESLTLSKNLDLILGFSFLTLRNFCL